MEAPQTTTDSDRKQHLITLSKMAKINNPSNSNTDNTVFLVDNTSSIYDFDQDGLTFCSIPFGIPAELKSFNIFESPAEVCRIVNPKISESEASFLDQQTGGTDAPQEDVTLDQGKKFGLYIFTYFF